jgi:aminopeptidase N
MEHAGFSFVSPQYISDREEGDWPLEQTESWLIAHMLGHQWFGGIVNYRSVSQAWLNEGFATYLDTLWSSHHEMPDRLQYEMHYKCRNVAASDSSESGKPMVNRDLADPDDIYEMDGSKIYNKGAWVIHMLRLQLGDERFWLGVRNYLHDHQWQGVETTDLRQALEKVSGRDLEQFFQQWVYGHGVPRLEVSYAWDAVRKLARVTVSQTQNTEAPTPAFAVPLEFCFRVNGNDTNITAELRDARQEFAYPFPTEPKLFCVDPRGALLKTLKVTMPRAFWSEQVRHGPTALTRLLAVEFLGKEPSPETVSTLGQVLTNQFEFWGVRQAAARELGSMQTDEALQALLRAEQSGLGHSKVLATTVQSIGGYIVSRHAHEVALKYANPTQPLGVETSAIQALGHLRATPELTERARGIVLAATAKTSRRSVRHTTFSALHSLDDVSGYETIFALAQPNTDDFRTEAIGLLGQLGRNDELRDRTRAALTEWLYDPDSSAQSAAISALGRLGDPHSISDLERIRTSARDESQRNGAERAIAAINRPENPKQSIAGLLDRLTALEKQIQALEKPLKSPTGPAKPSKEVSKNKKPPIPKSAK